MCTLRDFCERHAALRRCRVFGAHVLFVPHAVGRTRRHVDPQVSAASAIVTAIRTAIAAAFPYVSKAIRHADAQSCHALAKAPNECCEHHRRVVVHWRPYTNIGNRGRLLFTCRACHCWAVHEARRADIAITANKQPRHASVGSFLSSIHRTPPFATIVRKKRSNQKNSDSDGSSNGSHISLRQVKTRLDCRFATGQRQLLSL